MEKENDIKEIIDNILKYYIKLEKDLDLNENKSKSYYFNNEFDSNVTSFEALSNANQLGIFTNLDEVDAEIVIKILHCILLQNFFKFDYTNYDEYPNFSIDEKKNLESYNPKYFMLWIIFFRQNIYI